jgi:hypothetical protein
MRAGLWVLVGVGGIGGVVGLVDADSSPASRQDMPASATGVPADVAGFAQLAVGEWLGTGHPTIPGPPELFLDPGQVDDTATDDGFIGRQLTVVSSRVIEPGYWAVTVAASVDEAMVGGGWQPVGTWFLEVGVVRDQEARLSVVSEPAIVAQPAPIANPPGIAGPPLGSPNSEDEELISTAEGFLRALLAGGGDISRYLAPGTRIAAVSPAPFTDVRIDQAAVTAGHHVTRVRASVVATTDDDGEVAISYELTLAERAGRWEVTGMSGAPTLSDPEAGGT